MPCESGYSPEGGIDDCFAVQAMRGHYIYRTPFGTFFIRFQPAGHWHVFLEEQDLGGYATPEQAAAALSGDHFFWAASGIDRALAAPPCELSKWDLGL